MYKNILLGIFILLNLVPVYSTAQGLNKYLDSLAAVAIKDTVKMLTKDHQKDTLKSAPTNLNYDMVENRHFNTISFNLPMRTDRSVAFMLEYRPVFEREIVPWFSLFCGPIFYGKKMSGKSNGANKTIAIFSGVNTYYIDGWGQNMGFKLRLPERDLGLSFSFQRRDIHIYGPRAGEYDKGYQAYFDAVLDKRIKDLKGVVLLQADFYEGPFVFELFGGVGIPIWGFFDDRVNKNSGNRQKEWTYANQHNLIMMRNYDIYFGLSIGIKFKDFLTAQE